MTVAVREGCPTVTIPEYKKIYCTHNSNSAKRHNGQLVRKLFQPVELSTVVQKEKNRILHQKTDFPISLTYIRLDTDASRLCVIRKIWSRP